MASVDDRVQYGPLKKLEVKNCVAYSGTTCILGFLLFALILMLIPGDKPVSNGVISGVVLDSDNLPVENIEVSCPSFEPVTTNADGEFSFPEAVYGEYVLTIDHPNYEQETVNVVLGAASVDVDIFLSPALSDVTLTVNHLSSENLPDASVTLTCGSFVETLITDSEGRVTFYNARRGVCFIEISKTYFDTGNYQMTVQAPTAGNTYVLRATSGLSFTVSKEVGGRIHGAVVWILSGESEDSGLTNSLGNVYFYNLDWGTTYRIVIEAAGYQVHAEWIEFSDSHHYHRVLSSH
ncbi:hypothetical protein RCL1_006365 [Eukaryota sp. TZLM3-RCL]